MRTATIHTSAAHDVQSRGGRLSSSYRYAVGEFRSWGAKRNTADTAQLRHYATLVLWAMGLWDGVSMTATCPLTGRTFNLSDGQVDRVNPADGYAVGNVVLVSSRGNGQRSNLQQSGSDLPRVSAYADDVRAASAMVAVPPHGAYVPASVGVAQRESGCGTFDVEHGPYGVARPAFSPAVTTILDTMRGVLSEDDYATLYAVAEATVA
jgi:hypothetical protein